MHAVPGAVLLGLAVLLVIDALSDGAAQDGLPTGVKISIALFALTGFSLIVVGLTLQARFRSEAVSI
jgi:hypothetical protein